MDLINGRASYIIFTCLLLKAVLNQQQWPDDVNYEDLKSLEASCEPRDTCANVTYGLDGLADRDFNLSSDANCDCGITCIKYHTCCVDSPFRKHSKELYRGRAAPECVQVYEQYDNNIFMVTECHPKWKAQPEIQKRCNHSELRDPASLVPAYDPKNGLTYKNIFCGVCNGVELENLTLWSMTMKTTMYQRYSEEELVQNMTFNEEENSWGYWQEINDEFTPITITINAPEGSSLKRCIPHLIQNCDPAWTDWSVSQKCLSYLSPVNAYPKDSRNSKVYRNVHCAICNYAKGLYYPKYVCYRKSGEVYGAPMIFSTVTLKFNLTDGVQSGKLVKCKSGETYDPFYKKCRSLVCGLPGYVLDGKRCLRS